MLSGLKFIPRNQINSASSMEQDLSSPSLIKQKKKSRSRKEKHRSKKESADSDDDGIEKLKRRSDKQKWSSSELSTSSFSQTDSESYSDHNEGSHRNRKTSNRKSREEEKSKGGSSEELSRKLKKRFKRRKQYDLSEDCPSSASGCDEGSPSKKGGHKRKRKQKCSPNKKVDDSRHLETHDDTQVARKKMGLEWMLKPLNKRDRKPNHTDDSPEEAKVEEVEKVNPKELNPNLKDNGSGYPEDTPTTEAGGDLLLPSSLVGDGGASWRLKALKRAREQAAREGRKLDEVVEERWGSLGQMAVSVASRTAAHAHAHLHSIKDRRRGHMELTESTLNDQSENNIEVAHGNHKEYSRDIPSHCSQMREPKLCDSLSWRKGKSQKISVEDSRVISEAASNLNKFANDGSYLREFALSKEDDDGSDSLSGINYQKNEHSESTLVSSKTSIFKDECSISKDVLSANQLAAKVLQLRMKGKHQEAEKLLNESKAAAAEQEDNRSKSFEKDVMICYGGREMRRRQMEKEDDADVHLARKIMRNKQYSMSGRADDEYDYDDAPSKKQKRKRGESLEHSSGKKQISKRFMTQQERCQFCFENPSRPKHLVISIGNFSYLMLPQWRPVVEGHCCILTLQHESSTRNVDTNVWDEIRNFKKCLIMMFAKQEKHVIFLETVMGLARQRRHCMVECIPLPLENFRQAPLYFKKAIDEAEEEWSQHNAKKLIDTSDKGLRGSIPKDFPYFYVEFGLDRGFVHVIDDEVQFKSNFGLNVIRGMLQLPEEDMYRRRQHDSVDAQKQSVAKFARDWDPFDWTKQL